jgi:hypothetical protein
LGCYTRGNNVDRKIRHIVTGNLLQAFNDIKGKLVSYTTLSGQVKKLEGKNNFEKTSDKMVAMLLEKVFRYIK